MAENTLSFRKILTCWGLCGVIDPLGTGLSSRPEWTAAQDTAKAEAFFVDSLEEWREAQPAPLQSTTYQRDGWREKRRGR